MGSAAEALLYFGVDLNNQDDPDKQPPWCSDEWDYNIDSWYLSVVTGRADLSFGGEGSRYPGREDADALKNWLYERKQALESLPIEHWHSGCEVSEATSDLIVLRGHCYRQDWRGSKHLDSNTMTRVWKDHRQCEAAISLCKKYDICDFEKASWQLTASYG